MAGKKKEIAALPCNFDRHKKGDDLIRQELQKLLEVHREGGAILTEEGRVTLKDPKSKQTYTGLLWSQILDRAPSYFANKHTKVRNRELYGKTLHAEFVKMNKSRVVPEQQTFIIFSRIFWHIFFNHFFGTFFVTKFGWPTFLDCLGRIFSSASTRFPWERWGPFPRWLPEHPDRHLRGRGQPELN